jgi:effector-binding domain-containing protein
MSHEVEVVEAEPQVLAAVRRHTSREELPATIHAGLDAVYAWLREAPVKSLGLNVVVYLGDWNVEIGVRVSGEFESDGEVVCTHTPAGRAATCAHFGAYQRMREAYDAIDAWCKEHGERVGWPTWEAYGHWTEDEAQLRTDVYALLAEA